MKSPSSSVYISEASRIKTHISLTYNSHAFNFLKVKYEMLKRSVNHNRKIVFVFGDIFFLILQRNGILASNLAIIPNNFVFFRNFNNILLVTRAAFFFRPFIQFLSKSLGHFPFYHATEKRTLSQKNSRKISAPAFPILNL